MVPAHGQSSRNAGGILVGVSFVLLGVEHGSADGGSRREDVMEMSRNL